METPTESGPSANAGDIAQGVETQSTADGDSAELQEDLGDVAASADPEPTDDTDAGSEDAVDENPQTQSDLVDQELGEVGNDADGLSDLDSSLDSLSPEVVEDSSKINELPADISELDGVVVDVALCSAVTELCDGIDNDCDGATDEGFVWQPPVKMAAFAIGESCDFPQCKQGVVVCLTPSMAGCSTCPSNVDFSVILAAATAKPSPLLASGGFADVSKALPIDDLKIDLGSPLTVPYGASGMAIDADNDGDMDLVWSDGVGQVVVWTQQTPMVFQSMQVLKLPYKPAAIAATDGPLGPTLLVGTDGLRALVRKGDGSYADQTTALGLAKSANGTMLPHVIAADINDDGLLDIVAAQFNCGSAAKGLRAWLGRGPGGYVDAPVLLGLNHPAAAWAVMQTDYDDDGLQDLLMLTESCEPDPGIGWYRHQPLGATGYTYVLKASPPVFTAPGAPFGSPMGACSGDVNGDGVLDYFLSEIELSDFIKNGGDPTNLSINNPQLVNSNSNNFLLSQPGGGRKLAGLQAGLWAPLSAAKVPMVAWSPAFADLDHDGHLDLVLSHGNDFGNWATNSAVAMRPVVFRNDGLQKFTDVSAAWGLPPQHDARSLVLADLDGDGDDDLVLGGQAVPPRVLRNDLKHGGSDVRVKLKGATSNAWGLGARLTLQTTLRSMVAEHSLQAPTQTMAAPVTHFALKNGEVAKTLTVKWPSGWLQTVAAPSQGTLAVAEPLLSDLSTRWSPAGTVPVTVFAYHVGADGQALQPAQCSIELASDSQGQFSGPTTCTGSVCSRQWVGTGVPAGGSDALVIGCGTYTLKIRPRIFY